MQTLTIGSFVNFDNREKVEALKFTAASLAEHAAKAVAGALTAEALASLAGSFWEKAEYVTRETERPQLKQIFVDNFIERFDELKPTDSNKNPTSAVAPDSTIKAEESVESADQKPFAATAQDEFLGLVKSEEPSNESISEAQPRSNDAEQLNAVVEDTKAEKTAADAPSQAATAAPVKAPSTSAAKSNSSQSVKESAAAATNAADEPFEFEKCTISLNLQLLPAQFGSDLRKAIVSAASHGLPPEIEFLELQTANDLTEIARLVQQKLARFKQTLPAKYIEQLRNQKSKPATKKAPAPIHAKTPAQLESNEPKPEKQNGEQTTKANRAEVETPKTIAPQINAASPAQTRAPSVSVAPASNKQNNVGNSFQPSLF